MRLLLVPALLLLSFAGQSLQNLTSSVDATIYYMAQCPGCEYFITQEVCPSYAKLRGHLKLKFSPLSFLTNGTVLCKHGERECAIEKIEACGMSRTNDQDNLVDFICCAEEMAKTLQKPDLQKIAKCGSRLGLEASELLKCATGSEGTELLLKYQEAQKANDPNLTYVPWVNLNGKNDEQLQKKAEVNFFLAVCDLLDIKPLACPETNLNNMPYFQSSKNVCPANLK